MYITKERDPWLTLILACCLAVTISAVGFEFRVPASHSAIIWGISNAALLAARMFYGTLGHSFERFGFVHALALVIAFGHGSVFDKLSRLSA
jgi:hypothetical protein